MFLLRNNAICGHNDWFFVDFSLGKNECWMDCRFVKNINRYELYLLTNISYYCLIVK